MADEQHVHPRKHYLAGPAGRAPTEDEALEMGLALFDAITADRLRHADETSAQSPDQDDEEMTIAAAIDVQAPGSSTCACCGQHRPESDVVRLGSRPEVAVCLPCAHYLHQQARAREDARRPSPAARVRDAVRAGRRMVMRRGWHRMPVIGPVLRRLGRRLP